MRIYLFVIMGNSHNLEKADNVNPFFFIYINP